MVKEPILKLVQSTSIGRLIAGFYFLQKNHLSKSGWKKSVVTRLPIGQDGEELPWFTYSFIYFLGPKLTRDHVIFEYGSGNSTIWFSKKVRKIVSVEHDSKWFSQMKDKFISSPNITYISKDLSPKVIRKKSLIMINCLI